MDTLKIYKVWLDNNANGISVINSFILLEDAIKYAKEFARGHILLKGNPCSDCVFSSSKIAKVKVFDGDPFMFPDGTDSDPIENKCLYDSGYFYTDL